MVEQLKKAASQNVAKSSQQQQKQNFHDLKKVYKKRQSALKADNPFEQSTPSLAPPKQDFLGGEFPSGRMSMQQILFADSFCNNSQDFGQQDRINTILNETF